MPLECKSLIFLVCKNAILSSMASLPVTLFQHSFPESRIKQGLPHRVQKKPQASFTGWQKSLLNPKRRDASFICNLHHPLQLHWVQVGKLLLCRSKQASRMLCTGDTAGHGKCAPRAVCCTAAPWYLSLHPFFRYVPNHGYGTLSSPGNAGQGSLIFQLENVERTEVKWFSPELYSRSEAEPEPVCNSSARQHYFCLEYGHILKGRTGKYIKGKSSPC